MDILDDMAVSKLSAKLFFKVNYTSNNECACPCVFVWRVLKLERIKFDCWYHMIIIYTSH